MVRREAQPPCRGGWGGGGPACPPTSLLRSRFLERSFPPSRPCTESFGDPSPLQAPSLRIFLETPSSPLLGPWYCLASSHVVFSWFRRISSLLSSLFILIENILSCPSFLVLSNPILSTSNLYPIFSYLVLSCLSLSQLFVPCVLSSSLILPQVISSPSLCHLLLIDLVLACPSMS